MLFSNESCKVDQMSQKENTSQEQIQQLEHELAIIREKHDQNLNQLRILNEKLQTSDQKLHSANEGLETAREELKSLYQELISANNRLLETTNELEATNNDLSNFLTSTAIPTLFLNEQLRVRRLTPATKKLIKLLPADNRKVNRQLLLRKPGSGAVGTGQNSVA